MKATKETLSPTRVKLTVEVSFDELKPSVAAAYRKLAMQVRVAGFRPGKVPPRILDQRVGRGVVLEQALEEAVPHFYTKAVEVEEVEAISRPELDITDFADGAPLVFTAEVDVRPQVVLPALDSLEVTVDPVVVAEEQIDAELDVLRDQSAMLEPVERPVRDGDYVSLDMSASVDGDRVEGADANGLSYQVGSGNLVDGLDEAIIGAAEGESRTFETQLLAGDLAGQTAQVTVTVRGVKEKKRPDLDDEFATTASEFDTLVELRADIRERLERERAAEQVRQARDRLLDLMVERVDLPVPESILASEIKSREHRFVHELERLGTDREAYLAQTGKDGEEFDTEVRAAAEKSIRAQFILEAVIESEKIGMEQEELLDQIMYRAQRAGVSPEVYARKLSEDDGYGLTAVMADTMRSKAFWVLLENAKIVDTDGNAVSLVIPRRSPAEAGTTEVGATEAGATEAEAAEGDAAEGDAAEAGEATLGDVAEAGVAVSPQGR